MRKKRMGNREWRSRREMRFKSEKSTDKCKEKGKREENRKTKIYHTEV